jgi:hypothetical protein
MTKHIIPIFIGLCIVFSGLHLVGSFTEDYLVYYFAGYFCGTAVCGVMGWLGTLVRKGEGKWTYS